MNAYLPTKQQLNELVTLKTDCDINMEILLRNPRFKTVLSENPAIVTVLNEQLTSLNKVSQKCRVRCHYEGQNGFIRMRHQLVTITNELSTIMNRPMDGYRDIFGYSSPSPYEHAELKEDI